LVRERGLAPQRRRSGLRLEPNLNAAGAAAAAGSQNPQKRGRAPVQALVLPPPLSRHVPAPALDSIVFYTAATPILIVGHGKKKKEEKFEPEKNRQKKKKKKWKCEFLKGTHPQTRAQFQKNKSTKIFPRFPSTPNPTHL
jgi:hypothetical protein